MLTTHASRMAAGAVIWAALTVGSLGLTATAASACPNPDCVRGVPPVAASAMSCTDPKCISGTPPAAAPRPESRATGRTGHGAPPAPAGGMRTAASAETAHAITSTSISGGGGLCGTPTTPECPLS